MAMHVAVLSEQGEGMANPLPWFACCIMRQELRPSVLSFTTAVIMPITGEWMKRWRTCSSEYWLWTLREDSLFGSLEEFLRLREIVPIKTPFCITTITNLLIIAPPNNSIELGYMFSTLDHLLVENGILSSVLFSYKLKWVALHKACFGVYKMHAHRVTYH